MSKIIISEFDHKWEESFKSESAYLREVFVDNFAGVFHIGSTAVPEMAARPVVDILLVVNDINEISEMIAVLCENGYSVDRSVETSGDYSLHKAADSVTTHNLYIISANDEETVKSTVGFVRMLCEDPQKARDLGEVKKKLAEMSLDEAEYLSGKEKWLAGEDPFAADHTAEDAHTEPAEAEATEAEATEAEATEAVEPIAEAEPAAEVPAQPEIPVAQADAQPQYQEYTAPASQSYYQTNNEVYAPQQEAYQPAQYPAQELRTYSQPAYADLSQPTADPYVPDQPRDYGDEQENGKGRSKSAEAKAEKKSKRSSRADKDRRGSAVAISACFLGTAGFAVGTLLGNGLLGFGVGVAVGVGVGIVASILRIR